jgi:DNA mismatch repair protein MutS2
MNLSRREAQLAEHLAKIDRDMRALEHEQRLVSRERETLAGDESRLRQREEALRNREETFHRRLSEEIEVQARRARREIDEVISDLKAKTSAMEQRARAVSSAPNVISSGDTGSARSDARAGIDSVIKRFLEPIVEQLEEARPSGPAPVVGSRVTVGGLGLEGVVTAVHEGSADLDVRGKRMRADLRDLRVIGTQSARTPQVSVHVDLQPRPSEPADLNVIGSTVDEALARVERFLDESLLADQRVVRVIHGYGTGQLKRAVAGFLQQHPLVARFAAAPPEQGGGGVTIVELKD